MIYEDLYERGWQDRDTKQIIYGPIKKQVETFSLTDEVGNEWIMGFFLFDDDLYQAMINVVDEDCDYNEWENSETRFYGFLKTKEDLRTIMRFVDILGY
jgi:hypothetical protein